MPCRREPPAPPTRRAWRSSVGLLAVALVALPTVAASLGPPRILATAAAPFDGLHMAVADFQGDDRPEVVAQSDDGAAYVLDPLTGATLARLAASDGGCTTICYRFEGVPGPINPPAVADMDGDGRLDVVVANTAAVVARFSHVPESSNATSFAFVKVWERRFSQYQAFTTMDAGVTLANLTGDAALEGIVVVEQVGIFAVRADGSTLWQMAIPGGHASPSIADLDGNGRLEVVVARDDGRVLGLSATTGAILWTFDATAHVSPASVPMAATLADITGDGRLEVLFMARDAHDAQFYERNHAAVFALDAWGSLLWKVQPAWMAPLSHTRLAVVPSTSGTLIVGSDWNTIGHYPGAFERVGPGHAFALRPDGSEAWHRALDADASLNDIVVADVLGLGGQQVVAAGTKQGERGLHLLRLEDGAPVGFLPAGRVTRSHTLVADLHGDGKATLVAARANATQSVRGELVVWDGNHRQSAALPGWGAQQIPRGSAPIGAPPAPAPLSASFALKGNEWWLEAAVTSSQPLRLVTAWVGAGGPIDLPRTTWGAWAVSKHAPQGSLVRFVATAEDGARSAPVCATWTQATRTTCPSTQAPSPTTTTTTSPPPGNTSVRFTVPPGVNEWWVEVRVEGMSPSRVEAHVAGMAPVALAKQSWGSWARSFNVPAGTNVTFVAKDATGASATSPTGAWLGARSATGTFAASFALSRNVNAWWVEAQVSANHPVTRVEAQVDGGPWVALERTQWGTWAKSFHVARGASVEMRAFDGAGAVATSPPFTWP